MKMEMLGSKRRDETPAPEDEDVPF